MIVKIDRSFEKDTDKIKDKKILARIAGTIELFISSDGLPDISNLKKIKGYSGCYRIRIGNYRLGIFIEGNTVAFERCLHRKDIYKYFPAD